MVRPEDYLSFKSLAAQQKMTHVDFQHELLTVYLECKKKKHEAIIAALERNQDALVDELKLYPKRFGKIYRFPGSNTSKSSWSGDVRQEHLYRWLKKQTEGRMHWEVYEVPRKMTESHQERDGTLRVINWTSPDGQRLSFIANEKRLLCYRDSPRTSWKPIESENLGIAAALNRFGLS